MSSNSRLCSYALQEEGGFAGLVDLFRPPPPSFLKITMYTHQILLQGTQVTPRRYLWTSFCHQQLSFPRADNLAKFKQVFMSIVNARKFWCRLFNIFPFQSFSAFFQDMRMVLQVSACLTEITGTSQWLVFQWVCWLPLGFLFVFESEINSLS